MIWLKKKENNGLNQPKSVIVKPNPSINESKEFALKNFAGKSYYNKDINKKVIVSRSSIKKAFSSRGKTNLNRRLLLFVLDKIIQSSRLITTEVNQKDKKFKSYLTNGKVIINKKTINYRLRLNESANGLIYYDHYGIEIKKSAITAPKKSNPYIESTLKNKITKTKPNNQKGLKTTIQAVEEKQDKPPNPTNSKIIKAGATQQEVQFFYIGGETGNFLQNVERKPIHSVAITLDGEQGSGKTTTIYKFINDFAKSGEGKLLFASLEEHPRSYLAKEKVNKYLSPEAQKHIDLIGSFDSQKEFYDLVAYYDFVFIDSWQKLTRMIGKINFDEDLRKKFDGKVFVVIFQQTTTGRTKGGADIVFDGDIIIKVVKGERFSENYAYFDKNRYTKVPLENIKYMVADGKTILKTTECTDEINNKTENKGINGVVFDVVD